MYLFMQILTFGENDFMRTGGRAWSKHRWECVMIVNLKNHMHGQQLETCWKFAEMHIMKGFENIIVQYDWRIYKYSKVSTIENTLAKSTKQSSN